MNMDQKHLGWGVERILTSEGGGGVYLKMRVHKMVIIVVFSVLRSWSSVTDTRNLRSASY